MSPLHFIKYIASQLLKPTPPKAAEWLKLNASRSGVPVSITVRGAVPAWVVPREFGQQVVCVWESPSPANADPARQADCERWLQAAAEGPREGWMALSESWPDKMTWTLFTRPGDALALRLSRELPATFTGSVRVEAGTAADWENHRLLRGELQ